jgi:hypothetical protein
MIATTTRNRSVIGAPNANTARAKRYLPAPERDFDAIKHKKARIAVEIPTRSSVPTRHEANSHQNPALHPQTPAVASHAGNPTTRSTSTSHPNSNAAPQQSTVPAPANNSSATVSVTKHKEKVVNGLRHELDQLKPIDIESTSKAQGRKLRSQEATRFKSELSAYFPDYDEVIGNDPKEQRKQQEA